MKALHFDPPLEFSGASLELLIYQVSPDEWAYSTCGIISDGYRTAWLAAMAGVKVLLDTIRTEIEPEEPR